VVNGVAQLRAKFARVPELVKDELMVAMEKSAKEMVSEMNALAPIPEIVVGWTWGEVPKGALKIGQFKGSDYGRIAITIYATAVESDFGNFPAIARWFEFGTAPRQHKTGKSTGQISAQPYFYPVVRSNKSRVRGRMTRAVNKGMKRANG
jgi:hypothetical protein